MNHQGTAGFGPCFPFTGIPFWELICDPQGCGPQPFGGLHGFSAIICGTFPWPVTLQAVLAAASTVFAAMLDTEMKESQARINPPGLGARVASTPFRFSVVPWCRFFFFFFFLLLTSCYLFVPRVFCFVFPGGRGSTSGEVLEESHPSLGSLLHFEMHPYEAQAPLGIHQVPSPYFNMRQLQNCHIVVKAFHSRLVVGIFLPTNDTL